MITIKQIRHRAAVAIVGAAAVSLGLGAVAAAAHQGLPAACRRCRHHHPRFAERRHAGVRFRHAA
jgi:hypothetical protein